MAWVRGWLGLAGLVLALGFGQSAPAAAPEPALNPLLTAENYRDREIGDDSGSLRIGRMDIAVDLHGGTAVTTVTVTFDNPGSEPLEGDFTLDLPAGSLVTGYALDIEGTLRPGVLVAERQAKLAYEERVRENIDPGLAQVTRTNAFRTRVFPIPPKAGRTIRLSFVTPLSQDRPYVLPLMTGKGTGEVKLEVQGQPADVVGPDGKPMAWLIGNNGYATTGGRWADQALHGALTITPKPGRIGLTASRHASGDSFFEIVDTAPPPAVAERPRTVRIYWDRSLSRRDDDLARERDLLGRYLRAAGPQSVELVSFASDAPRRQTLGSAAEVDRAVEALRYGGASSFAGLLSRAEPAADICLLFSDGRATLDPWKAERLRCTLIAVSTAPDADAARLSALARRSDGFHLSLGGADPAEAVKRMSALRRQVAEVTGPDGAELDAHVLEDQDGRFHIVGRARGDVLVRLRGAGEVRRYALPRGEPRRHDGAGALWAARAIADADLSDRPDRDAILGLARRYSVATPIAAFVVLETVDDYVEAGIEPPPEMGKAALAEYREGVAERRADRAEEQEDRIEELVEAWDQQKDWWKTRFDGRRPRDRDRKGMAVAAPPPPPPPPSPPSAEGRVEELVVTAQRRESGDQQGVPVMTADAASLAPREKSITIEMEPWNPDRPYLKALKAAPATDFWRVFDAQQAEHGATPAFYLDVAEYLFRDGRKAEAVQMALSALDMPQANTATLINVADRMMRYGETARGLWLYERILWLEPDRPQPHRALALALIAAADQPGTPGSLRRDRYRRAADLLNGVIMTLWDGDYDGVEMVALMELNALAPALQGMGLRLPLDRRLVALLDVDLRVVLEWNTDKSDMDLWVVEPGGETAIYSNPLTSIGGHMSNDMTDGFGPEEYLLRRAKRGDYEVRVHVYRPDQLDPNGATTVRVRLYRNWGRPSQSMEVMELDLAGAKEAGDRPVGKFKVGN